MININSKPEKRIEHFSGTIELDKVYNFVVCKTSNGEVKYGIISITPEQANSDLYQVIEKTILNHCNKQGI